MNSGKSVFSGFPHKSVHDAHPTLNGGNGGGNSGAVISPAPGLGLSAYQDPTIKVKIPLPHQQGGS